MFSTGYLVLDAYYWMLITGCLVLTEQAYRHHFLFEKLAFWKKLVVIMGLIIFLLMFMTPHISRSRRRYINRPMFSVPKSIASRTRGTDDHEVTASSSSLC